jgi:hypothetical protein
MLERRKNSVKPLRPGLSRLDGHAPVATNTKTDCDHGPPVRVKIAIYAISIIRK